MLEEDASVIRVLLADDEAMIRAGVRAIVQSDPEIEVVAEAADGREAVELVLSHRPDVALLDIRMPRMDGLAATAEIRRVAPDTRVVILTTFGEDSYISQALGDGASGSCSRPVTRVSSSPGCTRSPRAAPTCPRRWRVR